MAEIHEISTSIFKYSPWSTSNLETLSQFLITHGECFRIDLAVPHKTPLQIYPGHHKVSSTTFFVNEKSEDGHVSDVEKAKNFLNDLTQAAIITSRNKKRKSKPKNAQNENHEDDTNQNNNNISNTRIMKSRKIQIKIIIILVILKM
ncbi:hypothetical protein TRFO_38831 [Tritrichomonas foetus]|uniref:Uncharacterized protein n=1 Tax=Tritrichomonas foetus TaxID=1144522 RepID=A0A1J4J6V9_9EUKA|nr:hypothetical protein TRFO_38831 [Tritrichomonas foetus]|eukprot:OHS94970.1 hypothetical protein TRFO_38831 [Tritrichomonas foetus]